MPSRPSKLEEALWAGFGNSLIIQIHLTLDLVKTCPFETQSRSLQFGTDKLVEIIVLKIRKKVVVVFGSSARETGLEW